jgi:hypothetical protein
VRSRLLTILAVVSLPLCLTTSGFWLRSYWEADRVILSNGHNAKNGSFCQFALGSAHGAAALSCGVYSFQLPASRAVAGLIPDGLQLHTSPFVAPGVYPIASYAKTVKAYGLPSAANGESFNFIGFGFASTDITLPRTGMRMSLSCVIFPLPAVAALTALPSLVWIYRRQRQPISASAQSPCPACGYSLIGNTSGVCPECGKPIDTKVG